MMPSSSQGPRHSASCTPGSAVALLGNWNHCVHNLDSSKSVHGMNRHEPPLRPGHQQKYIHTTTKEYYMFWRSVPAFIW